MLRFNGFPSFLQSINPQLLQMLQAKSAKKKVRGRRSDEEDRETRDRRTALMQFQPTQRQREQHQVQLPEQAQGQPQAGNNAASLAARLMMRNRLAEMAQRNRRGEQGQPSGSDFNPTSFGDPQGFRERLSQQADQPPSFKEMAQSEAVGEKPPWMPQHAWDQFNAMQRPDSNSNYGTGVYNPSWDEYSNQWKSAYEKLKAGGPLNEYEMQQWKGTDLYNPQAWDIQAARDRNRELFQQKQNQINPVTMQPYTQNQIQAYQYALQNNIAPPPGAAPMQYNYPQGSGQPTSQGFYQTLGAPPSRGTQQPNYGQLINQSVSPYGGATGSYLGGTYKPYQPPQPPKPPNPYTTARAGRNTASAGQTYRRY